MMELTGRVAVAETKPCYPDTPFVGGDQLPEFDRFGAPAANHLHQAMRLVLRDLGLDSDAFGTPAWNPIGALVGPGKTVLIKPNWVMDCNPVGGLEELITHTGFIAALIDYVALGLRGEGVIVVADAPLQHCDFTNLQRLNRMADLVDDRRRRYPGIDFVLENWQITSMRRGEGKNWLSGDQKEQAVNDSDYAIVDLGESSLLTDLDDYSTLFRVTNYNPDLMLAHHQAGRHEYMVRRRVLDADLLINAPKFKTHQKAGLTGALKNLVGVNGRKEFLPHHIKGAFVDGGDNYFYRNPLQSFRESVDDWFWRNITMLSPMAKKMALKGIRFLGRGLLRHACYGGSWSGNQTIPRTTIDLNHIVYCWDLATNRLNDKPRRVLNMTDGVVCGEGCGPIEVTARPEGLILGSFNPAALDAVQGRLIGYNLSRIPTLALAMYDVRSVFNVARQGPVGVWWNGRDGSHRINQPLSTLVPLDLVLPRGWQRAARGERLIDKSANALDIRRVAAR